jgi:hypothetical protein
MKEVILMVTTNQHSKHQQKKRIPKPGDVFAIPLDTNLYGFGRLTPQSGFAEFFNITNNEILSIDVLKNFSAIEFPFMITLKAIKTGQWKIIGNMPYDIFFPRLFRIAGQITCGKKLVDGFLDVTSELRLATLEEINSVPEFSICTINYLIKNIIDNIHNEPKELNSKNSTKVA